MTSEETYAGLRTHLRAYFAGHSSEEFVWTLGPAIELFPRLRIAQFAPGPQSECWVYSTVGAWEAFPEEKHGLEFIIAAPEQNPRQVELLTMATYYHHKERLGLGHTLPIGQPWLGGSQCDHLLVSLPYPYGPKLEVCCLGSRHVSIYWLLPITQAERAFKAERGQEALEQKFDDAKLDFWNPCRESVV